MLLQNIHVIHELINLILLHDDASTAIKELKFLWNNEIFTDKTPNVFIHGCISAEMHLRSAFAARVHSWTPLADARSASSSALMWTWSRSSKLFSTTQHSICWLFATKLENVNKQVQKNKHRLIMSLIYVYMHTHRGIQPYSILVGLAGSPQIHLLHLLCIVHILSNTALPCLP